MIIESFPVAPLGCNCTILGDEVTKKAIVVDPGGEADKILATLADRELTCVAIVHTHTHFDHVGATADVQEATSAPAMIHEGDLFLYQGLQMQLDTFGIPFRAPETPAIDRFLDEDDTVVAGDLEAGVLHTPGHTPGSICLALPGLVLAGDTLFRGSIGRTDLWKGDSTAIVDSIRKKLFELPDDTKVITGHGPATTIGFERRMNPFVR